MANKRKQSSSHTSNTKRREPKRHRSDKFNPNDYDYKIDNIWVPISKTRNASLMDYCIDWFEMYNINDINDKPIKKTSKESKTIEKESFLSFLLSKGNE